MSSQPDQATVHRFDAERGCGEVITDTGRVLAFDSAAFARSGLRLLRLGQRLNIDLGPEGIRRLWIEGIGSGQRIR